MGPCDTNPSPRPALRRTARAAGIILTVSTVTASWALIAISPHSPASHWWWIAGWALSALTLGWLARLARQDMTDADADAMWTAATLPIFTAFLLAFAFIAYLLNWRDLSEWLGAPTRSFVLFTCVLSVRDVVRVTKRVNATRNAATTLSGPLP